MTQIIAIYARYSTDNQNDRSIEDQFDVCRDHITKTAIKGRVRCFSDRAISGSGTRDRPSLNEMMKLVEAGKISIIVSESQNRLSRDIGDMSNIYKMTQHKNIIISTVLEGVLDKLSVGLTGTMSSIQIDQGISQVQRGQAGSIRSGRVACGIAYGYSVRYLNDKVELEKGLRNIVKNEANIVRWIYKQFINGSSIPAIRNRLNKKGIPSPRGGFWTTVTICGQNGRGDGILQNAIYKGLLTWNRISAKKHPITGVRHVIINEQSAWVCKYEPSLQIIDTKTWQEVQDIFTKRRRKNKATKHLDHFPVGFHCGHCGKLMTRIGPRNFICSKAQNYGLCPEAKKISHTRLKDEIVVILTETCKAVFDNWIKDLEQLTKDTEKKCRKLKNKIDKKQKNVENIVDELVISFDKSPTIQNLIIQTEDEIKKLTSEYEALPILPDSKPLKSRLFSTFIKASTPEAIFGVIDSATVGFDGDKLLITDIKPDWCKLTQIVT